MTVKSVIKAQTNRLMVDDLKASTITMTITATLTGDGSDNPNPDTDKYQFTVTPSTQGNMAAASGSSFIADIKTTSNPNVFIATVNVVGTKYGNCKVSGSKNGDPTAWKPITISVTVEAEIEKATIVKNFAPALKTNNTPGNPNTSPDNTTSIDVLITDTQGNIVPEGPITFTIANVRTQQASQTGVFYTSDKTAVTPTPSDPNLPYSESTVTQTTDTNGKSTLYVGTNANPGYIKVNIDTNSTTYKGGFIYIYKDNPGTESPAPSTDIGPDLSNYTNPEFPVLIQNTNITSNEFIGIFLNGKYQTQVSGSIFDENNSTITDANTFDLIPGTIDSPSENILIAQRTSSGDLIKSKEFSFDIDSPLPDPTPRNPILGPIIDPNGGTINLGSIYSPTGSQEDYITSINVSNDIKTLLDKKQYTAKAGDIIRLNSLFQGDYKADDTFKKNNFKYTKTLTAEDLTSTNVNITIPFDDISGYGTPKQSKYVNKYLMYYDYMAMGASNIIASSSTVQGTLSTRKL